MVQSLVGKHFGHCTYDQLRWTIARKLSSDSKCFQAFGVVVLVSPVRQNENRNARSGAEHCSAQAAVAYDQVDIR